MKIPTLAFLFSVCSLSSQAAVVYSGIRNIAIPFNFDGVYLNVATGVAVSTQPADWSTSPGINFFFGGNSIATDDFLRPVTDGDGNVLSLLEGSAVSSLLAFATGPNGSEEHVGVAPDQFLPGAAGYMGFSFRITGTEPQPYYGWLKFIPSNSGGAVIESWGVENVAGQAIQTGAIPEPSALVLLGAGLLPLARRRRAD